MTGLTGFRGVGDTATSFLRDILNDALSAITSGSIYSYYRTPNAGYFGQGEVFRSIGEYFAEEKQRADRCYPVHALHKYKQPSLKRKTMRSLVAPLPNKGWKGGR